MSGSDNQPPKDHRRKSRLPRYLNDTQERLDELRSELDDQLSMAGSDEGYPGSPHGSPRRPKSRGNPMDKLIDTTNMVILSNLPDVPYPKEVFAHDTLAECHIAKDSETPVVKRSKRDDMLFIYDLSDADQKSLVSFMRKHHPGVSSEPTMGVPPFRHMEDTTEMILNILRSNQREQMSYTEIYEQAPDAYLFLTDDFPYDTNRLVEIKRTDFYGMRVKEMVQKQGLDRRHLMCLINVRSLAPLVHGMISIEPRLLDRNFLEDLRQRILENASQILNSAIYALAVDGEALKKPLEHLVTCVPGVEVIWTANRKVIRKLELPERAITEPAPRSQAAQNAPADAMRQEQEAVKILSDILKKPSNLYMTLTDLEIALRKSSVRVERNLRQFITERPKHFQILGEDDYEVVTLSHRAQIKRVCNDLQKVLRPRKPKCISSADIAAAFANHWRTANEQDRRFNVEDFGVCFLDDLLVTIPQHWGVHCSEYVSTDGAVVRRTYGRGEEEIPDFVPRDPKDRVYAWIPRHHQTEVQRKALALLKQQVLNMFRGDPSAEALIGHLTHQNRGHGPEHNRLIRLAYLRANRPSGHQGVPHHGRDNPALPCNFEMEEKTFVPLYHRFCGEQVALINFGVKDLFELFDSMQDTFIASGHGQERTISLTSDARREILERRLIDVLRMAKKPLTLGELLQTYRRHATMTPYFDEFELKRALGMSQLVERSGGGHLFAAKPFFRYKRAVALQPDVAHVLLIFMLSYAPLDVATIANKFLERTGRRLDESILRDLENAGAIRLVTEFEQLYDLHDICRVVRNLVYKMNELPSKIYGVELQHCLVPNQTSSREVPIASLLSFTGDYTYFPPEQLLSIMHDFEICFEALGQTQFRLRQELMVWVPAPEEVEASQGRRGARGAHQAHRGVTQSRRGARGAHQGHRGGNRGRQT